MKVRVLALVIGAALSQSPFAQDGDYWRNVDNGFDKMISAQQHAPGAGDVVGQPRDDYFANVDASFEHALSHEPYAGPTGVTVARTPDYQVDRLVFGLRQDRKQTAEVAAARDYRAVK